MPVCPRCGGTTFAQGVCSTCGTAQRPQPPGTPPLPRPPPTGARPPLGSGPAHTTAQGLVLREILEDDPALPQGIVLRELPPADPRLLRPPPAPADLILEELAPEDELIDGFEGTHLDTRPTRARPLPPPPPPKRAAPALEAFPSAACPSCATPLADPYAPFCDACGHRLPRVRRNAAALAGPDTGRKCRRCGIPNAADRTTCTNCGTRL